jgi:hypothetical protein
MARASAPMATCRAPVSGVAGRTLPRCYRSFGTVRPMGQLRMQLHREPPVRRPQRAIAVLVKSGLGLRRLLVAPAVIGLALTTAACGGGSSNAGVARLGTTTTTASPAGATDSGGPLSRGDPLKYSRCMRSHSVRNFPDPGASDSVIRAFKSSAVFTSPTFIAASRACAKYNGGHLPTTPTTQIVSPHAMEKLLAVSRCMRSHGVTNFPDPNPITGEMGRPTGVSANSPTVLAALRACSRLARAAGLGPPNTGQ